MKIDALSLAIAATCFALPASAQDAAGSDPGEIVVEGERLAEADAVRGLVQRLADAHGPDMPATRYFDALCVSVTGLNPTGNSLIRERIVENAVAVGLEVQPEGCRVNALVVVWDEPGAVVARIKDEQPGLLPSEVRTAVDAAVARRDPLIVWHNEENRNQGGRRVPHSSDIVGASGSGSALNVQARVNTHGRPSRTSLSHSRGVVSAAIIIDADSVVGMETDRLADYATMRLLAPDLVPLRDGASSPSSVTAPFPQNGGAQLLSRFDRAYLTALYGLRPNAPAIQLARAVAEEFESGD